jgi:hypothetical protein
VVLFGEIMDGSKLVLEAVGQLRKCLADVPFCVMDAEEIASASPTASPDWAGRLRVGDGEWGVVVEARSSGQPRLAREAANAILRWTSLRPNAIGVFAAPYVSPEAADILWRENIGYVDLSGNCRLSFDQVYIRIEGQANKFAQQRDLRSLYSPKAERVLRTLLLEPKRGWKIKEVASTAGVSLGQTSNVKRLLEDREWLRRSERGICLTEPGKLLEEWSENYRYRKNRSWDFYSADEPAQIETKIAAACTDLGLDYALAGFSAASRWAPSVRYQRVMAYVSERMEQVAECAGLKAVSSGPNVILLEPYDQGVMAGSCDVDHMRITSPIQTYLDLRGFRGRGVEAAEAVLREVVKPAW